MGIRSILIFCMLALAACASNSMNYQRSPEASPKNAKNLPLWECVAEGSDLSRRLEYMINAASEEVAVTATQAALEVNGGYAGFSSRRSPDVFCKQQQIAN